MKIQDVTGRDYPAKAIFTLSIRALIDHFKESFEKQNLSVINDGDIKWVLTVPAIWSEAAKKFMRKCATDVSDNLKHILFHMAYSSLFKYNTAFIDSSCVKH